MEEKLPETCGGDFLFKMTALPSDRAAELPPPHRTLPPPKYKWLVLLADVSALCKAPSSTTNRTSAALVMITDDVNKKNLHLQNSADIDK